MTLSEELQWRGFVHQTTYKDITAVDGEPITFYWGVDPSAPSMTVGNLATAMMVRHFISYGHKAVLLVGGATGMIGDPDGKIEERNLKTVEEVETNKKGVAAEYSRIFSNAPYTLVDNYDWFKEVGYLEFLRAVGKHVPMRQMLGREFVQTRLQAEGAGVSYAEFSYVLIQAYDFLHLFQKKAVTLQVCGSDQWGNSIAGVDLIRRITGQEANVWSTPLVVNKTTGVKFGKSESGAVWLDPNMTSVYQFYQFWLNADDASVIDYLKIFTLLDQHAVAAQEDALHQRPEERLAQKTLAYEVTKLIHGHDKADSMRRISEVLFGTVDYNLLDAADFDLLGQELPVVRAALGTSLVDVLVEAKLATSRTEARRFLAENAIYINGQQLPLSHQTLTNTDVINGYTLVRRGRNNQVLVRIQ